MKQRIGHAVLVLLAGVLFPYVTILLLSLQNTADRNTGAQWNVILENGKEMDGEGYLMGILARRISADAPAPVRRAEAILARTWLYTEMGENRQVEEEQLGEYQWDAEWVREQYGDGYIGICQVYCQAIRETAGETIWYDGERAKVAFEKLEGGAESSGKSGYWLNQEEAALLAGKGYDAQQILEHFFEGIQIKTE